MGMLVIRHKVKDYSTWRPEFNRHARAQRSAGLRDPHVFRSSDDPTEVVIFFNTKDTAKAKDFVVSADVKSSMARSGVVDRPTFYFLESTEPLRVIGAGWLELLAMQQPPSQ